MSCGYSKEILALYIEDDLPAAGASRSVESHISHCAECRRYCNELRKNQAFIKSRFGAPRHESLSPELLRSVRHAVLAQIDGVQQSLSWTERLERFLMTGFRRHRYAAAGFVLAAVISVSLLGQIGHSVQQADARAAVFMGKNTLSRPAAYRDWVFVGSSLGPAYGQNQPSEMYHNVYIDPASYREYTHSGKFPDGTVMVLEMFSAETKDEPGLRGSYEKDSVALQVSVKDPSRFDTGWGSYDFTDGAGRLKSEADPMPETARCLSCHRDKADTDHVFTQFYPVLRQGTARL